MNAVKSVQRLLLFVTSCAASVLGLMSCDVSVRAGDLSAVSDSGSLLNVDPDVVNLGAVYPGYSRLFSVYLSNTGVQDMVISVRSSCGCTVLKDAPQIVRAGEVAEMSVRFDPGTRRGKVRSRMSIQRLGGQEAPRSIEVLAEVIEAYEVFPRIIDFGQRTRLEKDGVKLRVTSPEGRAIRISSLDATDRRIAVRPCGTARDSVELEANVVRWRAGSLDGEKLVIRFYDKDQPVIDVPVKGVLLSDVEWNPANIAFGKLDRDERMEREILLTSRLGKNIEIGNVSLEIRVPVDIGVNQWIGTQMDSTQEGARVSITVDSAIPYRFLFGKVIITYNDDDPEDIQIGLWGQFDR